MMRGKEKERAKEREREGERERDRELNNVSVRQSLDMVEMWLQGEQKLRRKQRRC